MNNRKKATCAKILHRNELYFSSKRTGEHVWSAARGGAGVRLRGPHGPDAQSLRARLAGRWGRTLSDGKSLQGLTRGVMRLEVLLET